MGADLEYSPESKAVSGSIIIQLDIFEPSSRNTRNRYIVKEPGSSRIIPPKEVYYPGRSASLKFLVTSTSNSVSILVYLPFGKMHVSPEDNGGTRCRSIDMNDSIQSKFYVDLSRKDLCNLSAFGAELIICETDGDAKRHKYRFGVGSSHPGLLRNRSIIELSKLPTELSVENLLYHERRIGIEANGPDAENIVFEPTGHNSWDIRAKGPVEKNKLDIFLVDSLSSYCESIPLSE